MPLRRDDHFELVMRGERLNTEELLLGERNRFWQDVILHANADALSEYLQENVLVYAQIEHLVSARPPEFLLPCVSGCKKR